MRWGETTGFHGPSSDPVRRLSGPPRCSHPPTCRCSMPASPCGPRCRPPPPRPPPLRPRSLSPVTRPPPPSTTSQISSAGGHPRLRPRQLLAAALVKEGRKGKSPKGGSDLRATLILYGTARTSSTTALCSSSTTARRALLGGQTRGPLCGFCTKDPETRERNTVNDWSLFYKDTRIKSCIGKNSFLIWYPTM